MNEKFTYSGHIKIQLANELPVKEIEKYVSVFLSGEGFYQTSIFGKIIEVDYCSLLTNQLYRALERKEVISAEGKLSNQDNGCFRILKKDGYIKEEEPVFLSELSIEDLKKEIQKRENETRLMNTSVEIHQKQLSAVPTPNVLEETKILLLVPYAEKDKVKHLGAKWDPIGKCWYCTKKNEHKFSKWIPAKEEFEQERE